MIPSKFHTRQTVYVTATGGFDNAKGTIQTFLGDYGAVVHFDNPLHKFPCGTFKFLLQDLSSDPLSDTPEK